MALRMVLFAFQDLNVTFSHHGKGKANLNCWDGPKTFFAAEMSRLQLTSVTCSNPLASLYYSWNTQETQELLWPGCVHKLTTCYLLLLNILQTTFRGAEFIPSSFIWHTGRILYHVYIICILVQPRQTSHICPARPCTLTSEKRISCCRLPWWPWPGWQPPSGGSWYIMIIHTPEAEKEKTCLDMSMGIPGSLYRPYIW